MVDVDERAAECVDDFDEAREVDVDDAVEVPFEFREHFPLDRFGGQHGAAVDPFQLTADRVRRVDLLAGVQLTLGSTDVDHQITRDRHHRGLSLLGIEADQQDRVAVGRGVAFFAVLRSRSPIGAQHEEVLGLARVVFSFGHEPFGGSDVGPLGQQLVGEFFEPAGRDGVRGHAAQCHDQHAGDREPEPHPAPQRRGALLVHGVVRCAHTGTRRRRPPTTLSLQGSGRCGAQRRAGGYARTWCSAPVIASCWALCRPQCS